MSQTKTATTGTATTRSTVSATIEPQPCTGLSDLVEQLRPAVAGIVGFSELLALTNLDGEQTQFVDALATATRHLDRLLATVDAATVRGGESATDDADSDIGARLDVAACNARRSLESGADFGVPAVCTVRSLLDQAVDAVAAHAAEREIEILADTTGDEHPIVVDEAGLGVVLTNLVSNAVEYSNGHRVQIVAVRVRSDDGFETFRFAVSDDGGSLDPTRTAHLFDDDGESVGADPAHSHHTWGGLAANQKWVARQGGQIEVAVDPGTSTTFWFDIPVPVAYADTAA